MYWEKGENESARGLCSNGHEMAFVTPTTYKVYHFNLKACRDDGWLERVEQDALCFDSDGLAMVYLDAPSEPMGPTLTIKGTVI